MVKCNLLQVPCVRRGSDLTHLEHYNKSMESLAFKPIFCFKLIVENHMSVHIFLTEVYERYENILVYHRPDLESKNKVNLSDCLKYKRRLGLFISKFIVLFPIFMVS